MYADTDYGVTVYCRLDYRRQEPRMISGVRSISPERCVSPCAGNADIVIRNTRNANHHRGAVALCSPGINLDWRVSGWAVLTSNINHRCVLWSIQDFALQF